MVNELCEHVSPVFRDLIKPPCFKYDDKTGKRHFSSCPIQFTNRELINGNDSQPVCPMFLHYHKDIAVQEAADASVSRQPAWYPDGYGGWASHDPVRTQKMAENREQFTALWKLDVDTGEEL